MNKQINNISSGKLKIYQMVAVSVTAANILIYRVPLKLDQ